LRCDCHLDRQRVAPAVLERQRTHSSALELPVDLRRLDLLRSTRPAGWAADPVARRVGDEDLWDGCVAGTTASPSGATPSSAM